MFRNISSKTLSTLVLILIVIYGFFKNMVAIVFSKILSDFFIQFGIDGQKIKILLIEFRQSDSYQDYILGWLLYYPSYFLLHISFIYILFNKQKRTRNYLTLGLTGLIMVSVGLALVGKYFRWEVVYNISYDAFKKLFGLPFILLFIEGGRILYNDIFKERN